MIYYLNHDGKDAALNRLSQEGFPGIFDITTSFKQIAKFDVLRQYINQRGCYVDTFVIDDRSLLLGSCFCMLYFFVT